MPVMAFVNAPSASYDLVVSVEGIRSTEGIINIGLFNDPDDFPDKGKAFKGALLKIPGGSATYTFKDLPAGEYCIAVFHDKNQNGKIDKNLIGIPTEGFGFSNDAIGTFGPPGFKDASVSLDKDRSVKIKLRHY